MSKPPEPPDVPSHYKFRLYVANGTQNSLEALANLSALCDERLIGRHEIEVVDVFKEPKRALADGILMTPTLLKLAPIPIKKVVGTLSQMSSLSLALGLAPIAP